MADLTTVSSVKAWLNITAGADDALLSRMVSSASDFVQTWLNRNIVSQTYQDVFDGNGGNKYMTFAYPVNAVASVFVDGIAIPASSSPLTPGYVASKTRVSLIGYAFSNGLQNCVVNYTAGYASIPTEIEQSCIEIVGLRYRARSRIGVASKSANGESISFSQVDLTGAIQDVLLQYKKVHFS